VLLDPPLPPAPTVIVYVIPDVSVMPPSISPPAPPPPPPPKGEGKLPLPPPPPPATSKKYAGYEAFIGTVVDTDVFTKFVGIIVLPNL
jgi:hypothetical protein